MTSFRPLFDGVAVNYRIRFSSFFASLMLLTASLSFCADDLTAQPSAERPYLTLFAASLDRLRESGLQIFESVDRSDLAKSIDERFSNPRNFAGIERTKPLGMMSTWNGISTADILFAPIDDIQNLLQTATFGVVGFHQVTPNHYEIERPGSPYQVLIRNQYALFGDSLASIRAIRGSPDQLTQGLRQRYDIGLKLDLLQIPQPVKLRYIASLRSQFEPLLQPQDDELIESASLRKTVGKRLLDLVEQTLLDTRQVTIGIRLDPQTRLLSLEMVIEAVEKSRMANGLNGRSSHRSEFAPLIQSDVPAGIAFQLPISSLFSQIPDLKTESSAIDSPLEAAIQFAGTGLGDLSLIMALHGPDANKFNEMIPNLILKLEKSGYFRDVYENLDLHFGVVLHRVVPRELPAFMTPWIGSEIEMLIGQGKQTVWLGIGHPGPLQERLQTAIELVEQPTTNRATSQLVKARFQAKKFPELVATDLLVTDTETARTEFSQGDDGFSLTVDPISNGLKVRIEFEAGFVRLIARGLINQLETSPTP